MLPEEIIYRPKVTGLAESLIGENIPFWIKTAGRSMYPIIASGDEVKIEPRKEFPKQGEIIAYLCHGKIVCHRVVSVRHKANGWFVTSRGDTHESDDAEIPLELIIGKVESIKRRSMTAKRFVALVLKCFSNNFR